MRPEEALRLAILCAAPACAANQCVPGDAPGTPTCSVNDCGANLTRVLGCVALPEAGATNQEADQWLATQPNFSVTLCRNGACPAAVSVFVNGGCADAPTYTACLYQQPNGSGFSGQVVQSDSLVSLCMEADARQDQPKVNGDQYRIIVVDNTGKSLVDKSRS